VEKGRREGVEGDREGGGEVRKERVGGRRQRGSRGNKREERSGNLAHIHYQVHGH